MRVLGKDVIGLSVLSVQDGSVLQTVDDVAYDPSEQRIIALLVDSGGLFSSAKAIHMDDVHNIGEDAVMVHDASVIRPVQDLGEGVQSISKANNHLIHTKVVTTEGKDLGTVTDLAFDSATGRVEYMEVSEGGFKQLTEGKKFVYPSDIVTIGIDATVVSTFTEKVFEHQAETNGLKGAARTAQARVADATDALVAEATENVKTVRKKVTPRNNTKQ